MKKTTVWIACILVMSIIAFSCNSSDDDLSLTGSDISQVITTDEGWRVTWFWDKGKDETSDFSGYIFYFRDAGLFEAVNNSNNILASGTWQIINDSNGGKKLIIKLSNSTEPLEEMEDDWIILQLVDNKIELKDDNDEYLEELHFEKA